MYSRGAFVRVGLALTQSILLSVVSATSAASSHHFVSTNKVLFSIPSGLNWYRGNTHTHTTNSDGDSSPLAVASRYKELGYNFVVITDHNRLTDVDSLNSTVGDNGQFLVMKGEEVTDSFNSKPVHINSINNQSAVAPQHGVSVLNTIENNATAIQQAGGVPYIAHPNFGFAVSADDLQGVTGTALFEIYNAHPIVNNFGDSTHPSVEAIWDEVLTSGHLRYGIAADDEHTLTNPAGALPGRGWIMVRAANLDPNTITQAITRGDFYASTGVTLQQYEVSATGVAITADAGTNGSTTIDFIGKGGRLLQRSTSGSAVYTFTGDEMYVRARITNAAGQFAWTQPVFTARLNSGDAIVNAASLGNEPQASKVVASDSIALASGLGLATAAGEAERSTDGTFPTTLGGATVSVNGRPAQIYFVSSTQLNFHVPDETELGQAQVVITNPDGIKLQYQLMIEAAAPGIFTMQGTGIGEAVTFDAGKLLPSPFFPNDSMRRSFIYVTGIHVTSQLTVLMNGKPVVIESVRECRRLPGLFQVNIAFPPPALSGPVSLVVQADGKTSNSTTMTLQ